MNLSDIEEAMHEAFEAMQKDLKTQRAQLLELAQKMGHKPMSGSGAGGVSNELAELLSKSDGMAAFLKGATAACTVEVPVGLLSKSIVNATGTDQPLVA